MNLQEAYYEQKFENEFLRSKGEAFQTFFARLMGFAYKVIFCHVARGVRWVIKKMMVISPQ